MRKLTYLMLLLLGVCLAQAELVDDFESYELGNINDVTTTWTGSTDSGSQAALCTIVTDPVDSTNKVIQFTEGGGVGQMWVRSALSPAATIAEGTTSTMFLRFKPTTDIDTSVGLTDLDTAAANWGDFRVQFVVHNAVQIRDAGSVRNLAFANTGTAVPWNTDWYNVWLVVDNAADTVKVYLNQTGVDATEADRCVRADLLTQDTFAFRVGTTAALDQVFWRIQNNTASRMLMIDDINITPGIDLSVPGSKKPYGPEVIQGTPVGTNIPTTLKWNAGADPDGIYAVNPAIVDEYIFMGSDLDPNLLYVGATGTDPGTEDPASEYSLNRSLDRIYYWAVVEAIDGYAQAFTVGDSIDLVDPNNIIGSTWSYVSTKSAAVINTHPADVRVFTTDPDAAFTVEFTSTVNPVTATWYKNDVALTAGGDITIDTDPHASSTLTIATPELADEGKYYCILSVDEGTTDDDLQTATRLLVIKKTLAQFNFENNLNDSSANGAPSGTVKTVSLEDPNEVLATVVVSPTYITGIEGSALYLDGTQFVDLGIEGYPKAGPLDTFGDARGEGYEKQGFGRGMEQGSILCWVKPTSAGAVYMNANGEDNTHFGLTTGNENDARMIIRGSNWDDSYQELGTAAGGLQKDAFSLQDGYWHMFAATWDDSGMRTYINGEQVASGSAGVPEIYTAWERSNLVGASRTAGTRQILNSLLTGAVDSLRVYNYVISADDIATEYLTKNEQGYAPCADQNFVGNEYNFDNSGSSYCKVDLADFAVFAQYWLENGLYDLP